MLHLHRDVFSRAKAATAGVTAAYGHKVAQFDGKLCLSVCALLLPVTDAADSLFTSADHHHTGLTVWLMNTSWCTGRSSRDRNRGMPSSSVTRCFYLI